MKPDIGHLKTEKLLIDTERKLDKVYKQAVKEVEEKFNAYMKKHLAKYDQMLEKYMKGEITKEQWLYYVKGGVTGQKYAQLLDALSADCTHTNEIAMSIVNGYTPEAYAVNRNYALYQLDVGGANLEVTFSLYDRHTVEKLVKEKKALLPKPKVDIPKDKRWNKQHIRNEITQGVLQGESIPKVAKRLERVVGMNRASAIRNARTAMTGAQNAGRIDSYNYAKNDLGINVMKEWLASGDGLTRDSHMDVSGERIKMDEVFSNGCEYPGDPTGAPEEVYNCRCTLLPYLPDYDFKEDKVGTEKDFDDWVENH